MKMIMAVLVIKPIISVIDKREKKYVERNDAVMKIIHPAEFLLR
ncbi:MAG: hypothetical protein ABJA37_05300 [Ferruginibacter sp.]